MGTQNINLNVTVKIEYLIRAAGAITECDKLIVIGSQSILGAHPEALLQSLKSTI